MENHVCCAQLSKTTAAAKVIRWDYGGVVEFREAIKVGELMMDNPQQFVCDFSYLRAGVRIAALPAEKELLLGGVYVLLPMQKYLRCVLSPSDMTSLNSLAFHSNSDHRKLSCDSRIFPALGTCNPDEIHSKKGSMGKSDQLKEKVAGLRLLEDDDKSLVVGLREHRIRGFRSWKPALETIKESPCVCNFANPKSCA